MPKQVREELAGAVHLALRLQEILAVGRSGTSLLSSSTTTKCHSLDGEFFFNYKRAVIDEAD